MGEIPEDIMAAAEDALDNMLCNCIEASGSAAAFRKDSITDIAKAIMAERERCALVADFYAQSSVHSDWSDDARGAAYYACGDVANAIRNPASPLPNPSADTGDDLPF